MLVSFLQSDYVTFLRFYVYTSPSSSFSFVRHSIGKNSTRPSLGFLSFNDLFALRTASESLRWNKQNA